MGRVVSLGELSEILGRSERTLIEDTDAGMPCIERGGDGKPSRYDTAAAVTWLLGQAASRRDPTVETERRRLLAAQATRAELELGARAGALVETARFRAGAERAARALTETLLAIPARIGQLLVPEAPRRAEELLAGELRQALISVEQYLEQLAAAATTGGEPHG